MKESDSTEAIHVYTDGACSGNPGPGGWGVVLIYGGHTKELSGGELQTTNNRMELLAAIKGIEAINKKLPIHMHTDSKYVKDGITVWLSKWQAGGWKTAQKKPVKNQDLWQQLVALTQNHDIQWHWIKAHNGHTENERADMLARNAIIKEVMTKTMKV
jgi:ribonuclease HI